MGERHRRTLTICMSVRESCLQNMTGQKLGRYRLMCIDPERLKDGAHLPGLVIWGKRNTLRWTRARAIPNTHNVMTRRNVFSLCRKLVEHLPVCGWQRVSTGFVKRRANAIRKGWDDHVDDIILK